MPTTERHHKDITILVAIYNAGSFIEAKIHNLQKQSIFRLCNIVLLNCQNNDNERQAYQEFLKHDNVTEIFYSEHVRLYPTWNDGIYATSSEYICNANVDDMWHPRYLEECMTFLNNNQSYACVSSGILKTDIPNQADHNAWVWQHRYPPGVYPLTTAGPCPVWRRSLHDTYGYFGNYRTIGDAKMWEKWHAGGEKFGLIQKELVLYYASADSLERRIDTQTGRSYHDLDIEDICENN